MSRALLHVLSRCNDPSRLDEFNTWYDTVHIPDIMELDGFRRASRYELAWSNTSDLPQYLAVYEVETDDVEAAREELLAHIKAKTEEGRVTRHDTFEGTSLAWFVSIFDDDKDRQAAAPPS